MTLYQPIIINNHHQHCIVLQTQDKNLRYESTVDRKDHTVTVDEEVTDGAWKNITLNINSRKFHYLSCSINIMVFIIFWNKNKF